jgi:hypothetical protein
MDYKRVDLLHLQLSALLCCCNGDLDCINMLQIELLREALKLDEIVINREAGPAGTAGQEEKFAISESFQAQNDFGIEFECSVEYIGNSYDLEYANYIAANSELNEMCNHLNESVESIKARFDLQIEAVNKSFGVRQDICERVFCGDSLRFGKFTRARKKLQFMDRAERRAFDLLALDLEIDEMELLDRIEHEYNKKEKTSRIRDLKRFRDYAINESIEYDKRMIELQKILDCFENRYSWIDDLELLTA